MCLEKAEDKKQGSSKEEVTAPINLYSHTESTCRESLNTYESLLYHKVCEEQARMVLPLNTMTEWWWSGSLDAFSDMCNLRCKEDTQYETRLLANDIDKEMGELFPVSWKELRK